MNHELLDNNKVFLTGTIASDPVFSHEVFGEAFYQMDILVPRLSGQNDNIPVTISDRLIQTNAFAIGERISIKGQFRSYNKLIDGKSKLILTVFVRELAEIDDSMNPNVVELSGYVCKEPVYRVTPFNREIADMLLAVNRSYNKSDYIPCIAWGRNARYVGDIKIGGKVSLVGRVQSREYSKVVEGMAEPQVKKAYEVSISKIVKEDVEWSV